MQAPFRKNRLFCVSPAKRRNRFSAGDALRRSAGDADGAERDGSGAAAGRIVDGDSADPDREVELPVLVAAPHAPVGGAAFADAELDGVPAGREPLGRQCELEGFAALVGETQVDAPSFEVFGDQQLDVESGGVEFVDGRQRVPE